MNRVYAPGCSLLVYKPHLAEKIRDFLNVPMHTTCCQHAPGLPAGTQVVNNCPGCGEHFEHSYPKTSTISLWELLAESQTFPFPDYGGVSMAIHDACPARSEPQVHDAVRKVLARMNIHVVEPQNTREKSVCCGDNFMGRLPLEEVKVQMKKRADEMPCDDVIVYCVSCINSMRIGGKRPRHIVDLLFEEPTAFGEIEPPDWHKKVRAFKEAH